MRTGGAGGSGSVDDCESSRRPSSVRARLRVAAGRAAPQPAGVWTCAGNWPDPTEVTSTKPATCPARCTSRSRTSSTDHGVAGPRPPSVAVGRCRRGGGPPVGGSGGPAGGGLRRLESRRFGSGVVGADRRGPPWRPDSRRRPRRVDGDGGELETGTATVEPGDLTVAHDDLYAGGLPTLTADEAAALATGSSMHGRRSGSAGRSNRWTPSRATCPGRVNVPSTSLLAADGTLPGRRRPAGRVGRSGRGVLRLRRHRFGGGRCAGLGGVSVALFPGSWSQWCGEPRARGDRRDRGRHPDLPSLIGNGYHYRHDDPLAPRRLAAATPARCPVRARVVLERRRQRSPSRRRRRTLRRAPPHRSTSW